MAVSLSSTACSSYLHPPHSSHSCVSKVSVGLRLQSPNSFGFSTPNLDVEFNKKVHKNIEPRPGIKPARGRIAMMPVGTPRVPYKNPGERVWQWVDIWNALYRERIIYIGQEIDDYYSNQLLTTMLYLDSVDSKKLHVFLNCTGGDISPSLALYDTMQSLKSPIGTLCIGCAYNLACVMLAGGDKGLRFSMPLATMRLEPIAGSARGQADDVINEVGELLRIRDYLFSELAKSTGQPLEKIQEDLALMQYFDAQEALEYGLIDRIIRPQRLQDDAAPSREAGTGLG